MEKRIINYVTGTSKKDQNVYSKKVRDMVLNPTTEKFKNALETGLERELVQPDGKHILILPTNLVDEETGLECEIETTIRLVLKKEKKSKTSKDTETPSVDLGELF